MFFEDRDTRVRSEHFQVIGSPKPTETATDYRDVELRVTIETPTIDRMATD